MGLNVYLNLVLLLLLNFNCKALISFLNAACSTFSLTRFQILQYHRICQILIPIRIYFDFLLSFNQFIQILEVSNIRFYG